MLFINLKKIRLIKKSIFWNVISLCLCWKTSETFGGCFSTMFVVTSAYEVIHFTTAIYKQAIELYYLEHKIYFCLVTTAFDDDLFSYSSRRNNYKLHQFFRSSIPCVPTHRILAPRMVWNSMATGISGILEGAWAWFSAGHHRGHGRHLHSK